MASNYVVTSPSAPVLFFAAAFVSKARRDHPFLPWRMVERIANGQVVGGGDLG